MGMVTDFFVAPRARAQAILSGDVLGLPALELESVDPMKLASLERILGRRLAQGTRPGPTEMLSHQEGEQWVLLVPTSLVELLARAADVTSEVGSEWATTRELRAEGWTAPDAVKVVAALAALASAARTAHLDLLLRMSVSWDCRYVARLVG